MLPDSPQRAEALTGVAQDVMQAGGTAEVFGLSGRDAAQEAMLCAAFDRTEEHNGLRTELRELRGRVDGRNATELKHQAQTLRRRFEQVVAVDFFPGPAQDETRQALDELDELLRQHMVPDEPLVVEAAIPLRERAAHRGRVWATRARPWVDRLASAWLIRRFNRLRLPS